jgi:hypothetical protein
VSTPFATIPFTRRNDVLDSVRIANGYGKYTEKQSKEIRTASAPRQVSAPEQQGIVMSSVRSAIVSVFFFGIPRTYLAHVKAARTYRGRLDNVQQTWDSYIKRLVQEYSNFLLIVSLRSLREWYHITNPLSHSKATVLLS